jgi:O-antigen ligase
MKEKIYSIINSETFAKTYLIIFAIFIFLPYRQVFLNNFAYITGAYSDFTSFSLYLSDILIFFGFLLYFLPNIRPILSNYVTKPLHILLFWLLIVVIFHYNSPYLSLNLWFLLKFIELIVAYGTFAFLFSKYRLFPLFLRIFAFLSTFEAILAISQFYLQKSIGLHKIGETLIYADLQGIAKIVSGGTKFIRAYGTFPHPNVLSAFLVISIMFLFYLLINSTNLKQKFVWSGLLFINIVGLTLTFSRAGYLSLAIGLVVFFGFLTFKNGLEANAKQLMQTVLIIFICLVTSFAIFKPLLLTRGTFSDQASIERVEYARAGIKLIKQKPIFGVGLGESVLHMEQAMGKPLEPWQKQPIHNYFILLTAELGIPGLLIFLWFITSQIYKLLTDRFTTYNLLLTTCILCILVLIQFDHYFYTIQQTQIIFWLILGALASQTYYVQNKSN